MERARKLSFVARKVNAEKRLYAKFIWPGRAGITPLQSNCRTRGCPGCGSARLRAEPGRMETHQPVS